MELRYSISNPRLLLQYIHVLYVLCAQLSAMNNGLWFCPTCGTFMSILHLIMHAYMQYFPDQYVRRNIKELEVVCLFPACGWTGQYQQFYVSW